MYSWRSPQFCECPLLLFTPFSFRSWWPEQCVTVFNLLRKPICYKLCFCAFVGVHVVTWYVKVGPAECIRTNSRFLTVNAFANNRLIQWPFVLFFFLLNYVRLCDEATSALDSTTEASILNSLKSLSVDRTSIFIAHRLTTAMQCDQVCFCNFSRFKKPQYSLNSSIFQTITTKLVYFPVHS